MEPASADTQGQEPLWIIHTWHCTTKNPWTYTVKISNSSDSLSVLKCSFLALHQEGFQITIIIFYPLQEGFQPETRYFINYWFGIFFCLWPQIQHSHSNKAVTEHSLHFSRCSIEGKALKGVELQISWWTVIDLSQLLKSSLEDTGYLSCMKHTKEKD